MYNTNSLVCVFNKYNNDGIFNYVPDRVTLMKIIDEALGSKGSLDVSYGPNDDKVGELSNFHIVQCALEEITPDLTLPLEVYADFKTTVPVRDTIDFTLDGTYEEIPLEDGNVLRELKSIEDCYCTILTTIDRGNINER